jgi:hypothetical protein
MIDKLQPRKLDKDTDQKLVQKNSMVDALNVYIDENLSGESGDAGVIKPIRGTTSLEFHTADVRPEGYDVDASTWRVLGSVTDEITEVVYFFCWSEDSNEQGVYAWDRKGVLPYVAEDGTISSGTASSVRKIFADPIFNFNPNSFVSADVVYTLPSVDRGQTGLPDNDVIIYFTDNSNEPRKLNVYRTLFTPGLSSRSNLNKNDYICACPKVPMGNIDFVFESDISVNVSNFESAPGFQFAIQGIYHDGTHTAIGPYSDIAFPPSVVNRGSKAVADTLQHNLCKIFIPTLPKEIKTISILARQGNSANFIELAEVPNLGGNEGNWVNEGDERHYKFYNNEIAVGVSPSEVSKIFDAVPKRAKSQSAINNRLVYGNFVEGYKPTQVGASLTPVFRARPSEGVDFSIGAIPSIVKHRGGHASGIEIDVSEIPDAIDEGTVVEFAFAFAPNQNFHVYNNRSSYSQTHMRGAMAGDLQGYPTSMGNRDQIDGPRSTTNTASTTAAGTPARKQEYRAGTAFSKFTRYATNEPGSFNFDFEDGVTNPESMFVSGNPGSQQGADELALDADKPSTRNFFGFNYGVGVRYDQGAIGGPTTNALGFPNASSPQYSAGVDWQHAGGSGLAAFGTSAAAPLIIQGGQVSFRVKFKVLEDIQFGARDSISDFVSEILTEGVGTDDRFEADAVDRTYQHDVALDLIDGQQLSPSQRKLITAVADIDNSGNPISDVGNLGRSKRIPIGYFILNRASVYFSLKKSDRGPDVGGHSRNALNLCIDDVIVPEDGIYTCLRKADPGSPWWAVSPDTIDDALASETDITGGWSNWAGQIFDDTEGNSFSFLYERLNDGGPELVSVGSRFVGRLKWSGRDDDAKDFWQNKVEEGDVDGFKFCLLDGAGGPGGFSPGNDSAFNNYGNADQGSITGQVLFTHYGTYLKQNNVASDEEVKEMVLEDVYNMCTWTQAKKNSIGVGGILYKEEANVSDNVLDPVFFGSGIGYVKAENNRAQTMGLPTVSDLNEATGSGPTANKNYPVLAMFTGPFFTGKIGMHPVVSPTLGGDYQEVVNQAGNDYNVPNPQTQPYGETNSGAGTLIDAYDFLNGARIPGGLNNIESEWLPPQVTQTTTLPYVLFNDVPIELRDDIPLFSLTFPVPIIDEEARDEIIESNPLFEDRETINIPLNPNPFDASTEVVSTSGSYDVNHIGFSGISLAGFNPHVEIAFSKTISSGVTGKPLMSFKSNATHEFGVVYFDERGRRGPVNSLGSVYVPGYSTQERGPVAGADGGPTFVNIGFNTAPPSWAHHYKIVYSKNTSVSDFFQYSTEGAYAVVSDQSDNSGTKIYMSLNYLQGHPISYSDAWGAKSQDGSPVVFQPKQGDKLRVISYNVIANGDQRKVFPHNVIFDVVGVESLSGDVDANPLLDQSLEIEPEEQEAYNSKQGLFLVLRDNPENEGFSAANIKANSSEWFNNVVFEIYRPIKSVEADKRIYYEIGPTYRVGYTEAEPTVLNHLNELGEGGAIEMSQGDVFFRLTPLNYKDIEGDSFINLIKEPEQTSAEDDLETVDFFSPESEPNFVGIYTEANSASDLFESDSKSIGRPAKIDRNDTERRREAGLIHSDRDIPKKRKLGYSSFNPSQADDKDVDPTGGPINFMKADKDSIIVLQKNKTSSVPVDRNIISTADNEVSLVASSNVLGTPRYYAAEGGTDSPESVASSTDATYFASKSMGKVFRFSASNGVMDISAKGMKAFFRDLFSKLSSNGKIIGGFDPKKEEYLVTVRDDASQAPNGLTVSQADEPAQVFGESPGSDISLPNVFDGGTPEGLEGDVRFTSQAIVFESQFYRPCCVDGDPFYPVRFAIDAIAAEASDSFTITEDIISYLEYALDQVQVNEDFRLRAGTLNSVITQSVRAQGYPDAVVAPFSPSTGDNLAVAFLESCGEETDPNRVYNASQLQSWATSVWGAPSAYTQVTGGTGFASEQFILDVSEELRRDVNPLCSISYADLWERWKNDYSLGNTRVPWNDDGTMAVEYVTSGSPQEIIDEYGIGEYALSDWSVFNDGGGTFPARINGGTELAALLTNQSGVQFLGSFEQFGIPVPGSADIDVYDVIPEIYALYINGDPSGNYPLALFQFQPILVDELATFLGVDPEFIPTPFRVNGDLLNDWDSVQEGAPQEEDGGSGGV